MDVSKFNALIALLDDEDSEVIAHVEQALYTSGEPIIPLLEKAWEEQFNPIVQKRIEDILHGVQFDILKKRLQHWKDKGAQDLLEGMWLVCTYQYPDLEYNQLKSALDQMYYELWPEFKSDIWPMDQIRIINNVLFTKLKFSPNTKNFHSPANSLLNQVIETKKGNPISLCVIYMLLAQKLKLPVYGVNLPNLFILTYKNDQTQFYINVFNKGILFTKEDIDQYLHQLNLSAMDIFYQPCSHLDIVARVFRNLIGCFEKLGEAERVKEVKVLLACIEGKV
ncbi:MAG: transglutaminase-like domain-containing protein [Cytophagaceae bacterium]|nr:transglutaminase-like domain-containing protein [Cytophagaceae bacterium]